MQKTIKDMKKCITLFLCFLLFSQTYVRLSILVNFELNKKYIAQNLCEKRAMPVNDCQGNCYLKKQLTKEQQNTSSLPDILKGGV